MLGFRGHVPLGKVFGVLFGWDFICVAGLSGRFEASNSMFISFYDDDYGGFGRSFEFFDL